MPTRRRKPGTRDRSNPVCGLLTYDAMTTRGPVRIKCLVWAERKIVKNLGRHNEEESTERSHETFLLIGTTPAEIADQLAAAIEAHPAPALKDR